MALTEIEQVYAEAVGLIGEIELTDASDQDTKPYSTCALNYANARDEMVRGYAWNEATDIALCLQDAAKPTHTWQYRFIIPADELRIITTSRPRLNWRVLSGYIYTNYSISPNSYTVGTEYFAGHYLTYSDVTYKINTNFTATVWATDANNLTTQNGDYGFIEIEYVKSLNTPSDWSVDLRHAIVLNLAAKIVIPITSDQERRDKLLEELHTLTLPHAQAIDAMQGKPKQFFYSEYTDSRE